MLHVGAFEYFCFVSVFLVYGSKNLENGTARTQFGFADARGAKPGKRDGGKGPSETDT